MGRMKSPFIDGFLKMIWALVFLGTITAHTGMAADHGPVIRVGSEVEFPPFAIVDKQGRADGFSIDLIRAVADSMGLSVVITTGSWDEMWNGLISGQLDALPLVAVSPDRKRLVDFCLTHTETFDAFFVREGDPEIRNLAAAQGKTIVVMRSDAAHHELLRQNFQGELVLADTIPNGLKRIASGKHAAFLCSKLIGVLAIKKHDIRGLTAGPIIPDYKRVFAFGVKKGDNELREKLDQGLLIVKSNGQYDRIYEKWLGYDDPWHTYREHFLTALSAAVAISLITIFWVGTLRRQVKRRTSELAVKNETLTQEMKARERVEDDLRRHKENLEILVEKRSKELLGSEERFQKQFKSTPMPTFIWEKKNQNILLLDYNAAAERLTQGTAKKFVGMSADQIYPDRQDILEKFHACFKQKNVIVYETDYRSRGTGLDRIIVLTFVFVSQELIMLHTEDVTEQRGAEDALRESEQFFRTVIRNSPLGIGIVDSTGNLIEANDALSDIVGYPREELLHLNFADFTHPDDLEREREFIQKMWDETTNSYRMEKRYLHKDGGIIWVDVAASVIIEQGKFKFGFAFVEDITERKQAEKQLRAYSERLEEMVEARTEELKKTQDELLLKERLAVLGHFAGSISHELRNPLAVIDSSAYFLKMKLGTSDRKISRHLGFISGNVKKSTAIIESLLSLARMEKPKTQKANLVDVVSETIAGAKIPDTVEVVLNFPEKEICVDIDTEQIRMALKNIMKNAIQAMNEAGKLTITSGRSGPGQIELCVADTGPGILPEHLEKVFQPLFSTKTHGIGFGLSLVKMVIENHGGTVRAKSDAGAVFAITLPLFENGDMAHA